MNQKFTTSLLFRHLLEKTHLSSNLTIFVSNNGMLYIDEIASLTDNWKKSVIILIPTRLGIDEVPANYISVIHKLFEFPQFIGIAGGKPRSARYFLGIQGGNKIPNAGFNY